MEQSVVAKEEGGKTETIGKMSTKPTISSP